MLKSIHIVQDEHISIAVGKLGDRILQGDAVDDLHFPGICGAENGLLGHFAVVARTLILDRPPSEVHQHLIDGHSMQPGRKRGIAAKTADLLEKLDKNFLREVFGVGLAGRHSEREAISTAMIPRIDHLEGLEASFGGHSTELKVRSLCIYLNFSF